MTWMTAPSPSGASCSPEYCEEYTYAARAFPCTYVPVVLWCVFHCTHTHAQRVLWSVQHDVNVSTVHIVSVFGVNGRGIGLGG